MNAIQSAIAPLLVLEQKARWKAMKSVKWVLRSPSGQYAAMHGFDVELVGNIAEAQVFDGRDNEQHKARFYSALLKVPMTPELISCAI